MGKCSPLTKIVQAFFAWAVLLVATGIFFAFPCQYLMTEYSVAIPIFQSIITVFVVVNFALTTFVNPGVIPKAKPEELRDNVVPTALYDIEIQGIRVRLKWCVTCQFYRPPRCVHCGVCDTCIETFDHHCPWVNNCIGRRNYRYFFMFLFWLSIHMISILSLCVFYIKDHLEKMQELQAIVTIVIVGIIVILLIPIISLTVLHIFLIVKGRTTNEQITGKYVKDSPYSRGCSKNILHSLCSSPLPRYKRDNSFYSISNQYSARNENELHYLKESQSSSSVKIPVVQFKYADPSADYILARPNFSEDYEETPSSLLNKGRLHLSLSESIYNRPESSNRHKGRALTPPVPIRFDCSRRSLPPHNKLQVPSPHYVVTQSVHSPVFAKDQSKISTCTSSQPSTNVLYYSHYQDPSLVKYDYSTDVCGQATNFYSQLYKKREAFGKPEGITFTSPDQITSIKASKDTCCLGNQTVDKIQEIANRTMISGQCSDVSVLEAFPKGCGSFHNSPSKEHHHDVHQRLIAQTPQQLFVNKCVDCQQSSSNHSCQSSISGEFVRTPGNRPLSFVRAMEMSESLEWRDPVDIETGHLPNRLPLDIGTGHLANRLPVDIQTGHLPNRLPVDNPTGQLLNRLPVSPSYVKVLTNESQSHKKSPCSPSVSEKKKENEISYEISV